jgi:hypothetical protein
VVRIVCELNVLQRRRRSRRQAHDPPAQAQHPLCLGTYLERVPARNAQRCRTPPPPSPPPSPAPTAPTRGQARARCVSRATRAAPARRTPAPPHPTRPARALSQPRSRAPSRTLIRIQIRCLLYASRASSNTRQLPRLAS